MKTHASPKLPAYVVLAALGCLAGLALGRPEPVLLGAPFLVALLVGAALQRPLAVRVTMRLPNERVVEGDEAPMILELEAASPVPWVEVAARLPDGLRVADGPAADLVSLAPGAQYRIARAIRCQRWGGYLLGEVFVRARDPVGLFVREEWMQARHPLRVYPRADALRSRVRAAETQVFAGNERSRLVGEGIEFAEVRPFAPGDRLRRINWRLTAQRGELYVNERYQERNSDVVLFLDTFAEARRDDEGTRFRAVRAAAALAEHYLRRRDRVGLVAFGGVLRWLRPAMGQVQRYRIIESLIETEIVFSYVWKAIARIPPAVLPPKALVIGITPLLDERAIDALLDLRARRFDLAIIEVSPVPYVAPSPGENGALAYRLWDLDRGLMRERLRRLGIPVARWDDDVPLEGVIKEVQAFRNATRRARA